MSLRLAVVAGGVSRRALRDYVALFGAPVTDFVSLVWQLTIFCEVSLDHLAVHAARKCYKLACFVFFPVYVDVSFLHESLGRCFLDMVGG